ncbi:MAG: DUF1501 domain-containing protein [Planctomycetes bacterium]|nr:DUF1501 domain-containing protein [Planctomycetota bacterium]
MMESWTAQNGNASHADAEISSGRKEERSGRRPTNVLDRRRFLGFGAASLGLAALPRRLGARQDPVKRVRGVIWLWMDGGMSQAHTWDPKPGTGTLARATSVEGIRISELLPTCAGQMRQLSILRSVSHGAGDLEVAARLMHVGQLVHDTRDLAPIGTILASELGTKDHPLPKHLTIGRCPVLRTAHFDEEFQPFPLNANPLNPFPNLARLVEPARDDERSALLREQTREWAGQHRQAAVQTLETAGLQAGRIADTPFLKAFDLDGEPVDLRAAYGGIFGQNCLLARRLVEAGCPFVELGLGGWKSFSKPVVDVLDLALGTLVRDLQEKKLLKDVLVVCATPFGREPGPTLNADPAPNRFSVVLAGGLLAGGRVVDKAPLPVKDLFATIYAACGIDPASTYDAQGRKEKFAAGGKPLAELF